MADMSLGSDGLNLIREFETFQSKMYDHDGGGHCTIGWGHLIHSGKCDGRENEKVFSQGIDQDRGDSLLTMDTSEAVRTVNRLADTPLNQNQFDALVSFTYNVGSRNLAQLLKSSKGSDGKLDLNKVPENMKAYNRSSGKILPGLVRRRQRESELFNKKQN